MFGILELMIITAIAGGMLAVLAGVVVFAKRAGGSQDTEEFRGSLRELSEGLARLEQRLGDLEEIFGTAEGAAGRHPEYHR